MRSHPEVRSPPAFSFDDLVGAVDQGRWDGEAEHGGGFQVDHEPELRQLLDWELGWACTFENTVDIARRQRPYGGQVGRVGEERPVLDPLFAMRRERQTSLPGERDDCRRELC